MSTRASNSYGAIYLALAIVVAVVSFIVMAGLAGIVGAGAELLNDWMAERIGSTGAGLVGIAGIVAWCLWARRLHVREQRRQFALDQTIHIEKRDWGRVLRYSIPLFVGLSIAFVVTLVGVVQDYKARIAITAPSGAEIGQSPASAR